MTKDKGRYLWVTLITFFGQQWSWILFFVLLGFAIFFGVIDKTSQMKSCIVAGLLVLIFANLEKFKSFKAGDFIEAELRVPEPSSITPLHDSLTKKAKYSPTQSWITILGSIYSENYARIIEWNEEDPTASKCTPVSLRYAMGLRWNSLSEIKETHKKRGRVVIDGHYSYLVTKDTAIQSRVLPLISSMLLKFDEICTPDLPSKDIFFKSAVRQFMNIVFMGRRSFLEGLMDSGEFTKIAYPSTSLEKYRRESPPHFDTVAYLAEIKGETLEGKLAKQESKLVANYLHEYEEKSDELQPNRIIGFHEELTLLNSQ